MHPGASQLRNCAARAHDVDSGAPSPLPAVTYSHMSPNNSTLYHQTGAPSQACAYGSEVMDHPLLAGVSPSSNYAATTCAATCAVKRASFLDDNVRHVRQKWGLLPYSAPAEPTPPPAVQPFRQAIVEAGTAQPAIGDFRLSHAPPMQHMRALQEYSASNVTRCAFR